MSGALRAAVAPLKVIAVSFGRLLRIKSGEAKLVGSGFLAVIEDKGGRPAFFGLYSPSTNELLFSVQLVMGVAIARGQEQGSLILYNGKKKFNLEFDQPVTSDQFMSAVEDVSLVTKEKSAVYMLVSKRQMQDLNERLTAAELELVSDQAALAKERDLRQKAEAELAQLKRELRLKSSASLEKTITASAITSSDTDWQESPRSGELTNSTRRIRPGPGGALGKTASGNTQLPVIALATEKVNSASEQAVLRGMTHRAQLTSPPAPLSLRRQTAPHVASAVTSRPLHKTHHKRLSEPFIHSWESPRPFRTTPQSTPVLARKKHSAKHSTIGSSNGAVAPAASTMADIKAALLTPLPALPKALPATTSPEHHKSPRDGKSRSRKDPTSPKRRAQSPEVQLKIISEMGDLKSADIPATPHRNLASRVSAPTLHKTIAVTSGSPPIEKMSTPGTLTNRNTASTSSLIRPRPTGSGGSHISFGIVTDGDRRYSVIVPQAKNHTPAEFLSFVLSSASVDPGTINTYLLCYRKWAQAPAILAELQRHYMGSTLQSPLQARVVQLLKRWLDDYMDDDFKPMQVTLKEFLHKTVVDGFREMDPYLALCDAPASTALSPSPVSSVSDVREGGSRIGGRDTQTISGGSRIAGRPSSAGSVAARKAQSRKSIMGWMELLSAGTTPIAAAAEKEMRSKGPQELLAFEVESLANELCLVDQEFFRLLRPVELVKYSETQPSPGIKAQSDHFNILSSWIASEIVSVPNLSKRLTVIKAIIRLGKKLKQARNFNSLMAIIAGLNLHSVSRLKATWKALPSKIVRTFEELENFMDIVHNFKTYREHLASCQPPLVPYFGLTLRDVTLLNVGVSDLSGGAINMDKMALLAAFCSSLSRYQTASYGYTSDPIVRSYVAALPQTAFDNEELARFSLLCEQAPET